MTDLLFHCPACGAALIAHPVIQNVEVWPGEPVTANPNGPKTPGYLALNITAPDIGHDCTEQEDA